MIYPENIVTTGDKMKYDLLMQNFDQMEYEDIEIFLGIAEDEEEQREIDDLQEENDRLEKENEYLEERLDTKDGEIKELEKENMKLERKIVDLKTTINVLKGQ